jgi:hypothetical protein
MKRNPFLTAILFGFLNNAYGSNLDEIHNPKQSVSHPSLTSFSRIELMRQGRIIKSLLESKEEHKREAAHQYINNLERNLPIDASSRNTLLEEELLIDETGNVEKRIKDEYARVKSESRK